MAKTTLNTVDELLENVIEQTDDSEIRYKLRTARQLVQIVEQRYDTLDNAITEAVDDKKVLENLRELGCIQ